MGKAIDVPVTVQKRIRQGKNADLNSKKGPPTQKKNRSCEKGGIIGNAREGKGIKGRKGFLTGERRENSSRNWVQRHINGGERKNCQDRSQGGG